MHLALYVAKLGWASMFVMLWLTTFGYLTDRPDLTLLAWIVFGSLTGVSTGIYTALFLDSGKREKDG